MNSGFVSGQFKKRVDLFDVKKFLSLKQCPDDSSACAWILRDEGNVLFGPSPDGNGVFFTRNTTVKIITNEGLQYGQVSILLRKNGKVWDKVLNVEGKTLQLNDSVVVTYPIDTTSIQQIDISEDTRILRFALPMVKPGNVIDYSYTMYSNSIYKLPQWNFQWTIPVELSKYVVNIDPHLEYNYYISGINKFDSILIQPFMLYPNVYTRNQVLIGSTCIFMLRNVPSFKDEVFISSLNDCLIHIQFQLASLWVGEKKMDVLTDWNKVIEFGLQDSRLGGYIQKSLNLCTRELNNIPIEGKTEREKALTIVRWVKDHYGCNQTADKLTHQSCKEFMKSRQGNTAEVNLYTLSLLKKAGIDADPILLSTRENGRIFKDIPFLDYLNYVAITANLDGKQTFLDATDPLLQDDYLPIQCVHDSALVLKGGNVNWLSLEAVPSQKRIKNLEIQILPEERTCITKLESITSGYDAYIARNMFKNDKTTLERELSHAGYQEVDSVDIKDQTDNENNSFRVKACLTSPLQFANQLIIIPPFMNEVSKINPFHTETRKYPIYFGPSPIVEIKSNIVIPDGYELKQMPQDSTVNNESFTFAYHAIKEKPNQISIDVTYNFPKVSYPNSAYTDIMDAFGLLVRKLNEPVILSKISDN